MGQADLLRLRRPIAVGHSDRCLSLASPAEGMRRMLPQDVLHVLEDLPLAQQ